MPVLERVLVVDDEPQIGVILHALLTKAGYDVNRTSTLKKHNPFNASRL